MINSLYKSASNADSKNFDKKNEEGFFFIFSYNKIYKYLQKNNIDEKTIDENLNYLGINEDGNIDGEYSNSHITQDKIPYRFNDIKLLLSKYRIKKEYPFIDNKINLAWNSLYIKAKLKASIFNKQYLKESLKSLDKLIDTFYINDELYHQTIDDIKPTQKGLLEDYSFFADLLFEAYVHTLNKKYFNLFEKIVKKSIKLFYKNQQWVSSSDNFINLADIKDSAYKNALAQNLINIMIYATASSDFKSYEIVNKTIDTFSVQLNKNPSYYPTMMRLILIKKYPIVFIKSNKRVLNNINLNNINYPFVYKKVTQDKDILACTIHSCFSYGDNFKKIQKDIESLLNK